MLPGSQVKYCRHHRLNCADSNASRSYNLIHKGESKVRLWLVNKVLMILGHTFRLIGIDIMFAAFYSKDVQKLEDQINANINNQ